MCKILQLLDGEITSWWLPVFSCVLPVLMISSLISSFVSPLANNAYSSHASKKIAIAITSNHMPPLLPAAPASDMTPLASLRPIRVRLAGVVRRNRGLRRRDAILLGRVDLAAAVGGRVHGGPGRVGVVGRGRHPLHAVVAAALGLRVGVVVLGAVGVVGGGGPGIAAVDAGELGAAEEPAVVAQGQEALIQAALAVGVAYDEEGCEEGRQAEEDGPLYDDARLFW